MKKIISIILTLSLSVACLAAVGCGKEPSAEAIILKNAPTVTSEYGEDLKIADDGVLSVKYSKDKKAEVKVTLKMIDVSSFNKKSVEEQTLKINYGGKSVAFTVKLVRKASSVSIKKAPTVTSVYTEVPFAIADDGVLSVNYVGGESDEIKITPDMIDKTSVDITSTAEQDVKVVYGGKSATFKVKLIFEEENNEGEVKTYRFEAEDAELEDQASTEYCGGQKRADGSEEQCVKNLFLSPVGGKVTFRITSNKKTQAKITFCISKQINGHHILDDMSTLTVNGKTVDTGITLNPGDNTGGWWDWQTYEVEVVLHLIRGENVIEFATNEMSGKAHYDAAGGKNLNYIELATTGTLAWAKKAA